VAVASVPDNDNKVVQLLTIPEVAERLRISRTCVFRLIAEAGLPSVKVGGSRRVSVDQLNGYIERLARGAQ
jgi:excisionase family DNA binding protein